MKNDFGKQWNRGCPNGRIFLTDIDDAAPKRPVTGDIWILKDSNYSELIKKASNETITSSTAMQNDNDIVFTLPPNGKFEISVYLSASGSSSGDIKIDWAVSGGASQLTTRNCCGPALSATDVRDTNMKCVRRGLTTDVAYGIDGSRSSSIIETFLVETGDEGTLQMRWAQNTSDPTGTVLSTNTYATCKQIDNTDNSKIKYYDGSAWQSILP